MRSKVVSLGLQQVSWQLLGSVAVVEGQGGREGRRRNTGLDGNAERLSPSGLGLGNGLVEEWVEQQVLQVWVFSVGCSDLCQENRSDDASSSPHQSDGWEVELPVVFLCGLSDQHESLGVRDDLGGVQGLLEVVDKGLLVSDLWSAGRTGQQGACSTSFLLQGRQTSGKHSLANQGDWHAEVQSVDGSPLSGTLLAGRVQDLLDQWGAVCVVVGKNVSGDLDQERVQNALVPLGKHVGDLLVAKSADSLHQVVSFANQLHVSIFDTVVDHLDIVAGSGVSNPVAAWLAVALGGNRLEDLLDVWPGLWGSSRHQGRTVTSAFLSSRDTRANKVDALLLQLGVSSVGVWEVRVTTVNDDVSLLHVRQQLVDEVVDRIAGLHEQNDSSRSLQLGTQLFH
ncbi:hypothetical protein OGATHE_005618 [Ogataea polymorpha]|uniref:Uncharacterized protein n=1 Tax=Ogataea polymorpha TaxID=460523 RepID=A0A9P8NSB1_9ASCO|nr:hypothetical protein OGATHE_005618 [Ogataea polymorpha]